MFSAVQRRTESVHTEHYERIKKLIRFSICSVLNSHLLYMLHVCHYVIELVGEDFPPGAYISFTPTFKHLGTIVSWDLREVKDVEARIKSANKLFGSAKATFWPNARVPFELRMRFHKAIVVNMLLWGSESWATQSKEVQALRVFQFCCLRTILKINVMHKILRATILEMCRVQDIIQTMSNLVLTFHWWWCRPAKHSLNYDR